MHDTRYLSPLSLHDALPISIVSRLRSSGAAGHPDDDYEICAAELVPKYELGLRAMSAVDFDDLLLLPVRLFGEAPDRKSTRVNSSHQIISYAVFCMKKQNSR